MTVVHELAPDVLQCIPHLHHQNEEEEQPIVGSFDFRISGCGAAVADSEFVGDN